MAATGDPAEAEDRRIVSMPGVFAAWRWSKQSIGSPGLEMCVAATGDPAEAEDRRMVTVPGVFAPWRW